MWLGIDLGTSSVKAAILDPDGGLRWVSEAPCEPTLAGDRAEIDPNHWWTTTRASIRRAPPELLDEVDAVGFSGQMHGLVLVDADNAPLRTAILWPDRRAVGHLRPFHDLERQQPGSLANPIVAGMPGPVLAWLRDHEPDIWANPFRVLTPKDWLRSHFTGEQPVAGEHSDASATLIYDARSHGWSADVRANLGLGGQTLPPLIQSSDVAGTLTPAAARALGLRPDIPVAAGAGDAAAALLGLGINEPGTILLNLGTGGQALTVVPNPQLSRPDAGVHQYRTASNDNTWYAMAAVLNCGLALDWVRTTLGMDWEDLYSHADQALTNASDDPTFVPFLAGERDPEVGLDRRASWIGLDVGHDNAALARSALLGIAAYLVRRTTILTTETGATRIILSGGATRNLGWAQLIANLIGHDVELASDANASVRGAAATAAHSQGQQLLPASMSGRIEPDPTQATAATACLDRLDHLIHTGPGSTRPG